MKVALPAVGCLFALAASACGAHPKRPVLLEQARQYEASPQVQLARRADPATFAEAEGYRRRADTLWQQGDGVVAELWAERALATWELAVVRARHAAAVGDARQAKEEVTAAERRLRELQAEHQKVETDVRAVEMRGNVIRDALPLAAAAPATGAREAARLESARALTTDAVQLCLAARLLGAETPKLAPAQDLAVGLMKALENNPRPAPVEQAMRARSTCLSALTETRRPARAAAAADEADGLLVALGRLPALAPVRDERGVVVTLHDAFTDGDLSVSAQRVCLDLRVLASSHPNGTSFAVLHSREPLDGPRRARELQRAQAVRRALGRDDSFEIVLAGTTRPLVAAKEKNVQARNERLEIVWLDSGR